MTDKINNLPIGKTNEIDQLVSRRLKTRRMLLGFTQEDLAKSIEVSIQQVQKYENATNRISSSTLYNMATFLKVPVTYFFNIKSNLNTYYNVAEEQEEYLVFKGQSQKIKKDKFDDQGQEVIEQTTLGQLIQNDREPYNTSNLSELPLEMIEKDTILLIRAFKTINNQQLRKKIIEVIKLIGQSSGIE